MLDSVEQLALPGALLLKPKVFGDARGQFFETYRAAEYQAAGVPDDFVQDNVSTSQPGTIRGLHFQAPPHAQAKLVTVLAGRVRDVILDIRPQSPTFGQWLAVELNDHNRWQLYIPAGFAHGFSVLDGGMCTFVYKCGAYYNQPAEGGIRWDDPTLAIDWGVESPIVSAKDQLLPHWTDFKSPF
jgi:dTDP-4-dehydrorhamnose 3,5-epimerase